MTPIARTTVFIALAAALGAGGYLLGRGSASSGAAPPASATSAPGARRVLYYRAPMSAATSPVPKKDPMGMDYVPVYDGDAADAPGTVVLDPARVQTLGVRTELVQRGVQSSSLRASATLEIDETREYVVAPRFDGWVAHLYANQTGMAVRAGQPLLAIYSPALAAARQEIAVADAAARRLGTADPAAAAAMRRLREAAVQRLRNGEVEAGAGPNVVYRSKVTGIVIDKPVLPGARFAAGDAILKVADLTTVWAVAHVPVEQAGTIMPGQGAIFSSSALTGASARGRVTFVKPVVDAAARTIDVRVELPNPGGHLRPGLFGQVAIDGPAIEALTVPTSAVIDSGARQVVLVVTAPGRFAPREVGLGRHFGDRVEILAGLAGGERVVTSANFLIDAESNLQSALQGLTAPPATGVPPTGAQRPSAAAPAAGAHPGHTRSGDAGAAGHEGH
jgi:Cu(I)/Ag(I) efflux system membrane fusion protein